MMDKLKLFFMNWKTSVPAILAALCATDSVYLKVLPPEWEHNGTALCVFLISIGLFAAKDADKTHSKVLVQPQPEPVTVPVEGADAQKVVPVVLLALLLAGCSSFKGTMLDGTVCTIATQSQNQVLMQQILSTYVNQADREKAQAYLLTAQLGSTALCEMLRSLQAQQAQGNPAPLPIPVQGPVNPS